MTPISFFARALWLQQERSRIQDASLDPLRQQAQELTRLLAQVQAHEKFRQMEENLRHTRAPLVLGVGYNPGMMSGENVPVGMDEGMVRLAQVMGQQQARRDVEHAKQAGINSTIGTVRGALKAAPGVVSSVGKTFRAAPGAALKGITAGAAKLDTTVNKAYQTARLSGQYDAARASNRVQDAANRLQNRMQGAVGLPPTPRPIGENISKEMRSAKAEQRASGMSQKGTQTTGPAPRMAGERPVGTTTAPKTSPLPSFDDGIAPQAPPRPTAQTPQGLPGQGAPLPSVQPPPMTPQQAAGAIGRPPPVQTAEQPGAAPPSAQSVPSGGGAAPGTPSPDKPPEAAQTSNPLSDFWKRTGLSNGAYATKIPMLAAGLTGMFGLYRGAQGVANFMKQEAEPAQYGGGPQPFSSVNAYNYPQ